MPGQPGIFLLHQLIFFNVIVTLILKENEIILSGEKMKRILLLAVILNYTAFADWGFFEVGRSYINIDFDGTSTWYTLWNTTVGNFEDANLGSFTLNTQTLAIGAWDVKTFKNSGSDVTGVNMFYRIYEQSTTPGSFSSTGGNWIEDLVGDGNQKWGKTTSTSIDITSLLAGKTYVLEVYIEAYGTSPTETKSDNNGGLNYIATFTTDNAFPVELASFSATTIGSSVKLNWQTATEVNNYGFDIERNTPLNPLSRGEVEDKLEKIGFVLGNGNSNSPKSYSFVDDNVSAGSYSYRLKQIDNDGQFEYSKVIGVSFMKPSEFSLAQNYPNPFNPTTTIQFTLPRAGNVKLTLFNLLGQKIKTLINEYKESGVHTLNFNASDLNSGLYIYKLEANGLIKTRKMTLVK